MKAIDSLRWEFYSLLNDTGLVDSNITIYNSWSYDEHLLRVIICYGLYPGICSVLHNEKSFSLKTMEDGQVILHSDGHLKMLGGYLEFFMSPTIAEMYRSLRRELDELIHIKLLNPRMMYIVIMNFCQQYGCLSQRINAVADSFLVVRFYFLPSHVQEHHISSNVKDRK